MPTLEMDHYILVIHEHQPVLYIPYETDSAATPFFNGFVVLIGSNGCHILGPKTISLCLIIPSFVNFNFASSEISNRLNFT